MTNPNENGPQRPILCDFTATLPLEQLYWLITTPPFGDDILDHAQSCEECARRVKDAGERAFARLSTEEQSAHRLAAQRILANLRPASKLSTTIKEAAAAFVTVVKGIKVERWTSPTIAVAGKTAKSGVSKLVLGVDDLSKLTIRPYVRMNLSKDELGWKAVFALQREPDPLAPGRDTEPAVGTVEILISRPGNRPNISVRLGSNSLGAFTTTAQVRLNDFKSGEQLTWTADVQIRGGARWNDR